MKLIIHRGTHEVGGSCVELISRSGDTQIVMDIGMPLVDKNGTPFKWRTYQNKSIDELLQEGILPKLQKFYKTQVPQVDALLISHAHQDHYGFVQFCHPNIPIHISEGTKELIEISNIFIDTKAEMAGMKPFKMWEAFQINEFKIMPYLVDHSAFDAVAFLIEDDDKKLFYTGDFRSHGRKGILFERLVSNPIRDVDCLVIEGTMLGRPGGIYSSETDVENKIYEILRNKTTYAFIFCSSQNIDRLVSIYRAVKRSGSILVIDLYTAFILDRLEAITPHIPQFAWSNIRIYYTYYQAQKLVNANLRDLLFKYKRSKIEIEEIREKSQQIILLTKDNRFLSSFLDKLGNVSGAIAIYSMWEGYLERSGLKAMLKEKDIKLESVHTSGHAAIDDLKLLIEAFKPRCIVPIHTFHPLQFSQLSDNVEYLKDGEELEI